MTTTIPEKAIELRTYYTWMGEDGIGRTVVKKNSEVTFADAKENSAAVNSLCQGTKFPLLIDSRDIKSIEKQARDYFSLKGRESNVNSFAIIIASPLSRIVGNFFMGLNKPTVPVKLFTDEREAISWLKQYL